MRKLLTGVLVAAVLVSQTSIADVFVHTDAATVLAADGEDQTGDTEENPVADSAEEQTVEEDTDLKEEDTPVISEDQDTEADTPEAEEGENNTEESAPEDGTVQMLNADSPMPIDDLEEVDDNVGDEVNGIPCGDGVIAILDVGGDGAPDDDESPVAPGTLIIRATGDGTGRMDDYEDASVKEEDGSTAAEEAGSRSLADRPWKDDLTRIKTIIIEDGVTHIGSHAFDGCTDLESVTIEGSVEDIGPYAFKGCGTLPSIALPDSVTGFGEGAFSGCAALGSIVIPNAVGSISDSVFIGCTSLETVTLPATVSSISANAFNGCSKLASINLESVTFFGAGAFTGTALSMVIYPETAFTDDADFPGSTVQVKFTDLGSDEIEITDVVGSEKVSAKEIEEKTGKKVKSASGNAENKVDFDNEDTEEPPTGEDPEDPKDPTDPEDSKCTCENCQCGDNCQCSGETCMCSNCSQGEGGGDTGNQGGGDTGNQGGGTGNQGGGNSGSGNNGGSSSGSSSSSSSGSSASSVSTSTGSDQSTDSTVAIPGTITVITYTVEPGDTLSKIALKYFGAASYWTKIYEDNKDTIADPNKIYVGQVIIINVAQVDTAAAAAGTTATGEGTYYTVESGDSLFKIAKKVYGNGKDWRLIYGANDAITDPGRIYSGQVIFIPVKQ